MTMYVNDHGEHVALPTTWAIEDGRQAKVTYHDQSGSKFSVIVRQKPNPIGFHAKLPGDKRKKP